MDNKTIKQFLAAYDRRPTDSYLKARATEIYSWMEDEHKRLSVAQSADNRAASFPGERQALWERIQKIWMDMQPPRKQKQLVSPAN